MNKAYLSALCLIVFVLDGWGYLLAVLLLIGIHWNWLSVLAREQARWGFAYELARELSETKESSDTVRRLRSDLHAEADAEAVLRWIDSKK